MKNFRQIKNCSPILKSFNLGSLMLPALTLVAGLTLTLIASAQTNQSAQELLKQDLAMGVKSFDKPVRMYSYLNTSLSPSDYWLQDADKRIQTANYMVQDGSARFWDLDWYQSKYANAGPGMYFALDPASSTEFGKDLISIVFKDTAKYIDTFNPIKIKNTTIQALVREQIMNPRTLNLSGGFSSGTFKTIAMGSENKKFRATLHSVLKELQVSAIRYNYKSYLARFCTKADQSAFVYIGDGEITQNGNSMLVSTENSLEKELSVLEYQRGNAGLNMDDSRESGILDHIKIVRETITKVRASLPQSSAIIRSMPHGHYDQMVSESFKCEAAVK